MFSKSSAMRYISTLSFYNLPRLRIFNVDRCNQTKWLYTKKQKQKKTRSRRYPLETIRNADYADGIELLSNALSKAGYLLYIQVQAVGDIVLYLDAIKREYMCLSK